MMIRRLAILSLCGVIWACDTSKPVNPVCRINDQHLDDASGDAGCFIRVNNKLVTIGHIQTGSLDTPGGKGAEGELAQCTAHRRTFEKTGFNVEVGELLGVEDNGFRFYQCHLPDNVGEDIDSYPVPAWAASEVAYIKLTDPFDTLASEWRHPKRHVENLGMFNKIKPEEKQ